MLNLFDKLISTNRVFNVEKNNLMEVLQMFEQLEIKRMDIKIDNNIWNITSSLTRNQWCVLLKLCIDNSYKLVIKDKPNEMYFEKV